MLNSNQIDYGNNGFSDRENEPEIDLQSFFQRLKRNWWVIALCAILGFVLARMYLRYTIPVYEATGTIFIKGDPESSGNPVAEGAVLQELSLFPSENRVINEIHIIRSRSLMERVIQELGLNIGYMGKGRLKDKEFYNNAPVQVDTIRWATQPKALEFDVQVIDDYSFSLIMKDRKTNHVFGYPFVVDLDTIILNRRFEVPITDAPISITYTPPLKLASGYQRQLSVGTVEDFSSVLSLSMRDPVPRKAADILNKLVEVYNREAIRDKNEVQRKTLDFINERLVLLTSELSAVESRVESYKEQQQIPTEAGASVELILEEISKYDSELVTLQIKMDVLSSIEDMLAQGGGNRFELIPSNQILSDAGGLSGQIQRYNQMVLDRERLLRSAGPDNPIVITANSELREMRQVILNSIQTVRQNLQISSSESKRKVDQLQGRIGRIPRQQRQLIEIKRQQNIKESLYLYLLQKKEEAALSNAVTLANARVIDPAIPKETPVAPKALMIYGMLTMLGMALPMGIIFIRDFLDDKIYEEKDIKKHTRIPFAGAVAQSKSKDPIVVKPNSMTPISEMFRMIRTNLSYLASGQDYQTIMITSGLSGDGKTFTALNIAMSLALSGKKTVLVGMDLRKPRMLRYLMDEADHKTVGVANFLVNNADAKDIIYDTELSPNLFYIPSGPIPPNPSELIGSPKTGELVEYLRDHFDYVIIDTAPIGLVTDAVLLSQYSDISLILVRSGKTPKGIIQMLERVRADGKLSNPGILLNGVKFSRSYGYGYGYGYGYYEKEKKGLLSMFSGKSNGKKKSKKKEKSSV